MTNSVYYILKQTHEPLFRRDDGQNYSTNLLKHWDRSVDWSHYTFCPDTELIFSSGQKFSMEFFHNYLLDVTRRYNRSAVIEASGGGCLSVKFPSPRSGYLDYLSSYSNAPHVKTSENVESGLGKYTVTEMAKDRIILARKKPVKNGYNKIVLYDAGTIPPEKLPSLHISDFNQISSFEIPAWVRKDYFSFDNLKLKSEVLIINTPDAELREAVYNCFPVEEFRSAFIPQKKDFYNVRTVLPLGVPGAEGGMPAQSCSDRLRRVGRGKTLVFCNWANDNRETLKAFFDKVRGRTGLNVRLVNYAPSELAALIYKKPRAYHLLVVMVSAMKSEHKDFLEAFLGGNSVLDFPPAPVKRDYKALLGEDDPQKKADLARQVAQGLADTHWLLTLYQGNDTVFYPKEIKNLVAGKDFMEYPEVADFRW